MGVVMASHDYAEGLVAERQGETTLSKGSSDMYSSDCLTIEYSS